MSESPVDMDQTAERIKEFDTLLEQCQQAAKEGDLDAFRTLDHQLRSMAMAMIGGLPGLEPGQEHYYEALKEAVAKLGETASEIDTDRRKLKQRQGADRKIRLAYSRGSGR